MSKPDTFCPIPWNFQAVRSNGDLRVCCQANITANKGVLRHEDGTPYNAARDNLIDARNTELIKTMRQNMMNGEWSFECKRCQTEEESGLVSRRNYEHDRWPSVRLESVIQHTAPDGTIDVDALPITYYDLRFGNLCNLGCRMCGPTDSTGWYDDWTKLTGTDSFHDTHGKEQLYKINGKWVSDSYGWHDSDGFWQQIESNAQNIRHVYMAGGEPLLIERHYEFLEKCVELGAAKNMLVEYNTNMTSIPNRALALWKNFKAIQIGASIDGFGDVFEYQRYPANWDKVWKNIQKVDQSSVNIQAWLAYTVTAYNVLHMPDFMRWKLESSGLKKFNSTIRRPIVTHHVAHNPHHLNIRVLPQSFKMLVKQRFDEFRAWVLNQEFEPHVAKQSESICNSVCDYMLSKDTHSQHWDEFKTFTTKLDDIRGQDIRAVVPELGEYL
jgi:Radical SAM superfamily